MAQAIWTGVISFGLLQVPVQLVPAERRHELRLRMLDARDHSPIRYERVNAQTGEKVLWDEIVKAYEYRKGEFVVLDQEDLGSAAQDERQTVAIEAFVKASSIAPMYFDKPYFLLPVKKSEKGYVLLRETLRDSGYAGLARVIIRSRQHLAALFPADAALVLNLIRYQQEIIPIDDYAFPDLPVAKYRVSPPELQMARQLIDSMAVEWNPGKYEDQTVERLRRLIERRSRRGGKAGASGKETRDRAAEASAPKVVDFMAVLKKSLESHRRSPPARAGLRAAAPAGKTQRVRRRRRTS